MKILGLYSKLVFTWKKAFSLQTEFNIFILEYTHLCNFWKLGKNVSLKSHIYKTA